jgi:hypothetical protein
LKTLAPIIFFVYDRPDHTRLTLDALALCPLADQSTLYIYADGPKPNATAQNLKKIEETRAVIQLNKWCKEVNIVEAPVNKGLARSTIDGITEVVNKHGKIIVLEDDNLVSPQFLTYINENLDFYEHDDRVISVQGYIYPLKKTLSSPFFLKGADTWGLATWKRGWDLFEPDAKILFDELKQRNLTREFDFNNTYGYASMLALQVKSEIDSWAIRWYASAFLLDKLTLYPPTTLVQNIGNDGSGTHKDDAGKRANKIMKFKPVKIKRIPVVENKKARKLVEDYFRRDHTLSAKVKRRLSHLLRKILPI